MTTRKKKEIPDLFHFYRKLFNSFFVLSDIKKLKYGQKHRQVGNNTMSFILSQV